MVKKGGSRYFIGKKECTQDEYLAHQKSAADKLSKADEKAKAAGEKKAAKTSQEA